MNSSICIFTHHYHPQLSGIGNFVDGLAHALVARGDKVVIVTNDSMGVGAGRSVESDLEIIRLPCISLLDGRLPLPKKNSEYYRLLQSLDEYEWNGVLVNTRLFPLSLEGLKFAADHSAKAVVLDHGSAYLSFNQPLLDYFVRRYEDWITNRVKSFEPDFYGISSKSVEWLQHFNISARGVISNSINAASYRNISSDRDFRSELGISKSSLVVAFVGRLIPEKGIYSIIEAARSKELIKRDISFVLAGDGPLANEVKEASSSNMYWVGRCSTEDISSLLQQVDVLCLPTRSEGFSTVLLEASACGTPSVVTDVGGARELIPDDSYGTIIQSMSSDEVALALCRLFDDRSLLSLQSRNSKALVEERYSWDATARDVEKAFSIR
mgnify:FL=1